ncbi:hypothetical protein A3B84_00070 [Candidatus Nomurabacteria bacterium RIFCSPHIGHO2_02_FULL_35_13]|uniref:Methyltransferase type 11 domain-containing protein n=1 Tax=Candidatus Nomurabacteria bacterium RIFCSPHIGHO2_02_FULL_35_13 TaxID=1801748 RepID=A0A1F6VPK7_9BACT|nr:MAG: hypothetical protein A3B84_00070 [Candidatus Nomurabacteria bacterium RIFCSPHIGHO2_02_FULL_35_13]
MEGKIKFGGMVKEFFHDKSLKKEKEKIKDKERSWGVYDSNLLEFGSTFYASLPTEYEFKSWKEGLRLYIENTLSLERKEKLTAVEFGGPGSRFFSGFSNDFFRKTIGVCLADIRNENLKVEDSKSNHYVITGDILDVHNDEIFKEIRAKLDVNKIDLIISRMVGGLNQFEGSKTALDNAVRLWYGLLNENGIMFIQYNYNSINDKEDNIVAECIEKIKSKYPQIDIQLGKGSIRLHKKPGAPEELPEDTHFFV